MGSSGSDKRMGRRIKKPVFVALLLAGIVLVSGVFMYAATPSTRGGGLTVVASFYPMYIATENIIGEAEGITLKNLSEPETGCLHDYQLTPEDMKTLKTANIFVVNGGGIENFISDVVSEDRNLKIVYAGHEDNEEHEDHEDHEDHEGHDHSHEENAHYWMSIPLYEEQIDNIAKGLAAADPDEKRRTVYEKNAKTYKDKLKELSSLEEEIKETSEGAHVIIFHEALELLSEDLGMETVYTMDLDEERQISAKEVAEVIEEIKNNDVRFILAEETYGSEMAERVKEETGVSVLYLDPLTRANGDTSAFAYIKKMKDNLLKIRDAL